MIIDFNQFNKDIYTNLDDSYIGKYNPVAYGKIASVELTCINSNYSPDAQGVRPIYRMPDGMSDYGTAYLQVDDVWKLAEIYSVDYETGRIEILNGRSSSGTTYKCKLVDCYGYMFDGHSYPRQVLQHWFATYGGIQYTASNFAIDEWVSELDDSRVQADIGFLLDDYDYDDDSDDTYGQDYLWKTVFNISNKSRHYFLVDYNSEGKITARLKDYDRVSSATFASVDIKNVDELPIETSKDNVYSKIYEKYYHDSVNDTYLSMTDNTYETYVKQNYRRTQKYTDETYLVNSTDATYRAGELALTFKDIPLVATLDLADANSVRIYDVITVAIMPDNLDSSQRKYAGNHDCLVIGTAPQFDQGYNELTCAIIPDRTPSDQQIAVNNGEYTTVSRASSVTDIITNSITDITTGTDDSGVIDNPDVPSSIVAVASENGITLQCVTAGTGVNNSIKSYIYQVKKATADDWDDAETITSRSNTSTYLFDRDTDGYMEIADFAEWTARVQVVSVYGKYSGYTDAVSVDTDSYGTWVLPTVQVISNVLGRSCILSLSLNTSALEVYGDVNYKVKINREDLDGDTYYKPDLISDPYGDGTNYKDGTGYVEADSSFNQTLPLAGQSTGTPVSTTYRYSIIAYTSASESSENITTVVALDTESTITGELTVKSASDDSYKSTLSCLGLEIKKRVSSAWATVGKFFTDKFGNLFITNDPDNTPFVGLLVDGTVYSFDGVETDEDSGNGASLTITADEYVATTPVDNYTESLSGTVTKDITSDTDVIECWNKSKSIIISDTLINQVDGTTESADNAIYVTAEVCNDNASTDWGLTSDQVSAELFVEGD